MTLRFSTIRRILTINLALTHTTCLALAIYLCRSFVSRNTIWIIGFLEVALVFLYVNSAVSKLLLKHSTSVMQELCSNFAAFALNSVLSLLVVSLEVKDEEMAHLKMGLAMHVWVRIVLAVMFTHFSYTIVLVMLAMLTHFSFDKNVWKRDIDSSPAPFPFPIIIPILLPCFFHPPDMTLPPFPSGPTDASPVIRPPCTLQGSCQCPEKPALPQMNSPSEPEDHATLPPTLPLNSEDMTQARPTSMPASETRLSNMSRRSSIATSQSLVQIPSAAQRRMSFPLTLAIWSDEMEE
ncbi:hypothetical protein J3R30DRAFT_1823961 [Lentinula aciculospora]|uniref:Uncharacterized protein n=1 Tax=Lentinula aciculospora TaxID=153920 RepID=A0A9W9AKP0_9AGAR|nr:hypothetical protein J3R30DRAFT_1823961 [Lentinula aciculospora]